MKITKLSDKKLKTLSPQTRRYRVYVENQPGLFLLVNPSGRISFQYRFQLNGRRRELSLGTYPSNKLKTLLANYAEAVKAVDNDIDPLAARAQEEEERRQKEESNITFGEYFTKFYLPLQERRGKKSVNRERGIYNNHLKPIIGKLKFQEIKPFHLERIKYDTHKRGLSPRSANYHLDVIRQAWNQAVIDGKTDLAHPVAKVKKNKIDNRRERYLTLDEEKLLLSTLAERSQKEYELAVMSLDTGARWGELAALRWENIDLADGRIIFTDTKSGRSRPAYLTERAKVVLIQRQQTAKSKYAFSTSDGRKLVYQSDVFSKAVKDLGLNQGITDRRRKVTFHTLRHTFASRLVMAGVDLYTVKELLGHQSIQMTERYAHLAPGKMQAAIKDLEAANQK